MLNTGLLVLISSSINNRPFSWLPGYNWQVFLGLLMASLVITWLFQRSLIRLTTSTNHHLEKDILTQIRSASYDQLQQIGTERVYAALGDLRMLSNLPAMAINSLNAVVIISCCFYYLFDDSVPGAFMILGLMGVLLVFYLARSKRIEVKLNVLRNIQNDFLRYLNDLLTGFKDIRISTIRSGSIFERFIDRNRKQDLSLRITTGIQYMGNELTGAFSWYILLGAILFVFPYVLRFEIRNIASFLITILYMMGPMAVLISIIPAVANAKIALQRIDQFMKTVNTSSSIASVSPRSHDTFEEVSCVAFEDVEYIYFDPARKPSFFAGPINLSVMKGECVFITGGNGSGKSTFVNLLTGLIKPSRGNIRVNDIIVTRDNEEAYGDIFGVIFTDSFLFSENYDGTLIDPGSPEVESLMSLMKLDHAAFFLKDKQIFDPKRLSKGQQKRLALVYTLLRHTPILVLDEWAAEQDPEFRKYFYRQVLPTLKKRGITVIAITHDDAYFSCADRIIKFEYGKIASDSNQLVQNSVMRGY
jgi:cyclic peptide transporter